MKKTWEPLIFRNMKLSVFFACLFFLLLSAGCSDSTKKKDNESEDDIAFEIEGLVGPDGGQVEITDSESSLYNIKIDIPPGALEEGKTITVSSPTLPSDLPLNVLDASNVVELGPDGTTFNLPVDIFLPYKDKDNDGIIDGTYLSEQDVGILFHNESTGEWEDIEISDINIDNNTVKASVSHFSIYLVYVDPAKDDTDTDTDIAIFYQGEYFINEVEFYLGNVVEKGCINRTGYRCGDQFYLTVSYFDGTKPAAVIDKFPTTNVGPPVAIAEDGTSVTFNAGEFFTKVLNSGSASLWTWESEFDNHTHLVNFDTYQDEDNLIFDEDKKIYSSIEVLESGDVKITWGFDVYTKLVVKDQVVIAFEAYYK